MAEDDLAEFGQLLDAVCGLLSRGAYTPNATNTALFFRAMARWPLAEVRAAFDAHVADPQRGRFVPVPADLIAQLEARAGDDGRPGAEEAFALALAAADEAETVVWTAETAEAWGVAQRVLSAGDEVGARMAFREVYARLVAEARAARRSVQWQVALGHDRNRHADALRKAADLGRIPRADADAAAALPAPRAPVLLLAGGTSVAAAEPSPAQRQAMQALRAAIEARAEAPSADALERQRTAQLQAQAAQKVATYTGAAGGTAA